MLTELDTRALGDLLCRQIDNLFTITDSERDVVRACMETVLDRTEYCFSRSQNKYYHRDGQVYFTPFHSGQYSIYLYYFSNQVFVEHGASQRNLADKIYYLNKALNGLDLYYEVAMPKAFFLDHPVGTVMGRGDYGEGFTFSQNCTVGNNKGKYPRFGENVSMLSGAKVIGDCSIGDNVIFSANSYVKDTDVPANTIVFGQSPTLVFKARK